MYKALFELSPTRADFLSKLFCRPRFPGADTVSDVGVLLDLLGDADRDSVLARRTLASIKQSLAGHGFTLTAGDITSLEYVYDAFCTAGPNLDYSYPNARGGFGRGMPSYAELMLATDSAGTARSYVATETNYRMLRTMHARNLIVPVVGDFAGPKAIRAVAQYLKRRGATVTAFYTSNVEQYLFQQGDDWRRYYENVETLPLDSRSTFIRSIGGGARGFGRGPGFGRLGSVLSPMQELLKAYRDGRVTTYADVIRMSR
jgi:DNA segregation ATPase FtsK/SpoIIIE-like protein